MWVNILEVKPESKRFSAQWSVFSLKSAERWFSNGGLVLRVKKEELTGSLKEIVRKCCSRRGWKPVGSLLPGFESPATEYT